MTRDEEQDLFEVAKVAVYSFIACVVLALLAGLAGCAAPMAATPNAARTVYMAEADFAAALRLVVAYENLPVCGDAPQPCSTPAVVSKVTAAAKAARASLDTAEGLVRSGSGGDQVAVLVRKAAGDVAAFKALAGSLGQ